MVNGPDIAEEVKTDNEMKTSSTRASETLRSSILELSRGLGACN